MQIPDTPLGPTPEFPNRPAHPDFARLSELVLELDAQSHEADGVDDIIARIVDEGSVSYLAFQRALRVVQLMGDRGDPVVRAAGLYVEGFVMGYRFNARYRSTSDQAKGT